LFKSINEHLIARKEWPASGAANVGDRKIVIEQVARIDVHGDRLVIRLKSVGGEEASDAGRRESNLNPLAKAAIQEIQADSCPARRLQK